MAFKVFCFLMLNKDFFIVKLAVAIPDKQKFSLEFNFFFISSRLNCSHFPEISNRRSQLTSTTAFVPRIDKNEFIQVVYQFIKFSGISGITQEFQSFSQIFYLLFFSTHFVFALNSKKVEFMNLINCFQYFFRFF